MPKAINQYVTDSVKSWYVNRKTYCLIKNAGQGDEYLVRVIPDGRDAVSYWLNKGQTWETESGAAWSILNDLDESE
jgi:hypothetical protein